MAAPDRKCSTCDYSHIKVDSELGDVHQCRKDPPVPTLDLHNASAYYRSDDSAAGVWPIVEPDNDPCGGYKYTPPGP